jgi:hypothetical protein
MTTIPGRVAQISVTAGDGQTGTLSTTLANTIVVTLNDGYANTISSSETLQFVVVTGSGSVSTGVGMAFASSRTATPIASLSSFSWKVGAATGLNQVEIGVFNDVSSSTVTANASCTNPVADTIALVTGNNQSAVAGTALTGANALVVNVTGGGSAAPGQVVDWTTTAGTLGAAQTISGSTGFTNNTLTLPTTAGAVSVLATAGAITGSPVAFTETATFDVANKLAVTIQPSSQPQAGKVFTQQPQVTVQDTNGNTVTNSVVAVTAALISGGGTLSGTLVVNAVAGVATFTNLAYSVSDLFQIRFSSGALTTADANAQNPNPPYPSALAIITQPVNTALNTVISPSVMVAIQDANGQTVTTATDSVTISLTTPGGATLSGTKTVSGVSGVATFSDLAINTAGTYTLTVSATGLTSAVSAQFTIGASNHPNEPSGMSSLVEINFASTAPPTTYVTGNATYGVIAGKMRKDSNGTQCNIASVTGSPKSSPYVWRATYQNGFGTGTGPNGWLHIRDVADANNDSNHAHTYSEMYEHLFFRHWGTSAASPTANWNYATNTNWIKALGFRGVGVGGAIAPNTMIFRFGYTPTGGGTQVGNTCAVSIHQSNPAIAQDTFLYQNVGGRTAFTNTIPMGTAWNSFEFYGKVNTIGQSDGIAQIWINGTLVLSYTNVLFRSTGPNNRGFMVGADWSFILGGGTGQSKNRADGTDIDYVYQSFKGQVD